MSKLFNQVKNARVKRNAFDLSHERKFSMNMGDLVPILCEEVVPGDSFKLNTEVMMRLAPLVSPMMHRVNVFTHFFFVPNRLVWDEWQLFLTGGEGGLESATVPYFDLTDVNSAARLTEGSLADYLGVQSLSLETHTDGNINALPFRAYQLIYNEYYRDQNVETPVNINKDSGEDDLWNETMTLRRRMWEKDYFTSAFTETQKGGEVNLPLGDSAPIVHDGLGGEDWIRDGATGSRKTLASISGDPQFVDDGTGMAAIGDNNADILIDNSDHLSADLSNATSATVNDLRTATRLQRWLERNLRNGSRYIEQILAHFGVLSSDARLQRPEYLGGGKSPVVISEVLQTSETTTSPQGNLAGHGISVGNTHEFNKFFEEHGYVIGIMSVLPRTAYAQGIRKHFLKTDRFDYFWPEFAHLGEQPINYAELLFSNTHHGAPEDIFGYQSRYAEYKFIPSTVHGEFRDNLDHWHMARKLQSASLNINFIASDPTHRVFTDTDDTNHKLYVQVFNNLKAIRPMPYFGTPTL